jgi:acetyltransferase-like isoleucine patch superfamily enzyme
MNPFVAFFAKVFLFLQYKKEEYLFWRSKKYINSWGELSYGLPSIISFDKKSKVSVGSYVSIASNVTFLLGANHASGLVTTFPIDRIDPSKTTADSNERGNIEIGNDVWIGYGATLIGNVRVGDGAIIGAHALVVDDIPPYAVVGGVPAKVIKYRFSSEQIEKLLAIAWWNWNTKTVQERQKDIYSKDMDSFIAKYS